MITLVGRGDVFQSGGGPPHSDDAGAFALRRAIAKGPGLRPSRALRRDFAPSRHPTERAATHGRLAPPRSNLPQPQRSHVSRRATRGTTVKRASVLECSSPLELWPKAILANQRANGFSPRRGYWRAAHSSRNDTARANEPWLLWLASGDVFQSGGGPPHSDDAGAFALRLAIAKGPGRCDVILHDAITQQGLPRTKGRLAPPRSNLPRPQRPHVSAAETAADRKRIRLLCLSSFSIGGYYG